MIALIQVLALVLALALVLVLVVTLDPRWARCQRPTLCGPYFELPRQRCGSWYVGMSGNVSVASHQLACRTAVCPR